MVDNKHLENSFLKDLCETRWPEQSNTELALMSDGLLTNLKAVCERLMKRAIHWLLLWAAELSPKRTVRETRRGKQILAAEYYLSQSTFQFLKKLEILCIADPLCICRKQENKL